VVNENYLRKVKYKTGGEVFVVIIRRINEEAFLAFAGNEPLFVTEVDEEAQEMITEYFPEGAEDMPTLASAEQEAFYEDEEEEEENYGEEEFEENAIYPFY
jgi:hypothetical protein